MVNTISKEEVSKLPLAKFEGRIVLVNNEEEAKKAISELSTFQVVGFDTETRPSFKKGQIHKIALMQLSADDVCYLFRVNQIGIPECLTNFLCDPQIKKIGLSLKDDFSAIRKRVAFTPESFVELQVFSKKFGIAENGLQRMYAILFDEKISKRQRLTNWEAKELTEPQQMYAALDAWACLKIYNKLIEIKRID